MKGFKKKGVDEHDQPTEPLVTEEGSPFAPTVDVTAPIPQSDVASFTQQQVPFAPQQPPLYSPISKAYPYLPSAPRIQKEERPAGRAAQTQPEKKAQKSTRTRGARRSLFPLFVGLFFVAVQLLLLLRFALAALTISPTSFWVNAVYDVSSVFVLPFRLLFLQVNLPLPTNIEVYTLLAILVYGLLSRLLVRLLKAIFSRR